MGPDQTVEIIRRLLIEAMVLSTPLLVTACSVSLLVSLLQTLTGVQEQTLTAVPRLIVVFIVTMVSMPWTIHRLVSFYHAAIHRPCTATWDKDAERDQNLITDWPHYLTAALLVALRLSGLMVFRSCIFICGDAPRIKAGLLIAMTVLLAPPVAGLAGTNSALNMKTVLGELAGWTCLRTFTFLAQ